jgi:hypothetical protein
MDTSPFARIGVGKNGSLEAAGGGGASESRGARVVTDQGEVDGKALVNRRHIDYLEHQIRWRFLMDSHEGGERYRNAVYGQDRKGLPLRNLIRHRREYPDPQQFPNDTAGVVGGMGALNPGTPMVGVGAGPYPGQLGADPGATAHDDDYEMRRSRTPVPEFVAEAVETHLSKVYDQEVTRDAPPDIVEWWEDVDGSGTSMDDWMRESVAPLLVVLGCLDIVVDHPKLPKGEQVKTKADEMRLGLDTAVASYILPENMVWWRNDAAGRYVECLVKEYQDPSDRVDVDKNGHPIDPDGKTDQAKDWRQAYVRYRHWTSTESTLYKCDGSEIIERVPHGFGCVPIVRLIDQKKHRTRTIGKSRYEAIAELQREFYNRDSELILSDTLQAHPLLSGPEDYCKADNTLSIGPGYVLPKKKNAESGTYEGWEYTSPPKDPAESLRKNKQDLIDMKDRRACLTKPAGVAQGSGAGGGSGTTAQSGVSKQLDATTGHKLLSAIAKSLARAERLITEFAWLVLHNQAPSRDELTALVITYPQTFELMNAGEITDGLSKLQNTARNAGDLPIVEAEGMKRATRQLLVGMDDDRFEDADTEIEGHVAKKAEDKRRLRQAGITDNSDPFGGSGNALAAAGDDPTGQAGSSAVGSAVPALVQ